jgi:hypothetical protein
MAALVLGVAGASLGGALSGATGAMIGRLAGAMVGNAIDHAVLTRPVHREGPRLAELDVTGSTEGAPIPRLFGRAKLTGQVIWATRLEEVVSQRKDSASGKGIGPKVTTTTYSYFANLAIGLCEGEIARVQRVWADGKLLDLDTVTMRVHRGGATQLPDALIVAKEGDGFAPAYRGLAYVVFERLALEAFGNRVPQFAFEVVRPIGELEEKVRAVTLIPGAGEYVYAPTPVAELLGPGRSVMQNRHVLHAASDLDASLDDLQALCPNLESVALVVTWFGTDLRAGQAQVRPQVEVTQKYTQGDATVQTWRVAGLDRAQAMPVSQIEARPAYGGTPSDRTVIAAIRMMKARGLKVTLYPFIMMDVPTGNTLPDPWTGAATQPPYPWRGRITCDPAPGRPGSPDGTAAAATQVNALFGTCQPLHFTASGDDVAYSGPTEWSLRRLAFHYARLATIAGGVDGFVIASELIGLTRVRAAPGTYPAVTQLKTIAQGVRAMLGPQTAITYAADWTEYGAHVVTADASEVRFPLDPLWADSAIDAIGIDFYAPLADWREGHAHLDRAAWPSPYARGYLQAQIAGGEAHDWFYAGSIAREAQIRTPITDGLGKPWLFRQKDLRAFWSQPHRERVNGSELAQPTAWVPQSKPIWITELGCPAVDRGSNQPSVFPDPKSSEAGLPPFSSGARDDLAQRRHLEAVLDAFDPARAGGAPLNPVSSLDQRRMVDVSRITLWTWDARPYPAFPDAASVWSDGAAWRTGHWLTGRLGAAPLERLVTAILAESDLDAVDTSALEGLVDGFVIDRPMSARAALEGLAALFQFEAVERDGILVFRPRGGDAVTVLGYDDLVIEGNKPASTLTRANESELPGEIAVSFIDEAADYRASVVTARRLVGASRDSARIALPAVTSDAEARRRAEIVLQDAWAAREQARFLLPPSRLALEPGDVVDLALNGRTHRMALTAISDTTHRQVDARGLAGCLQPPPALPQRRAQAASLNVPGPVLGLVMNLPRLPGDTTDVLQRLAVFADPWPGRVMAIDPLTPSTAAALVEVPALTGTLVAPLPPGPCWRIDRTGWMDVQLDSGALASIDDMALLAGGNAAAVRRLDGQWEVLQFGQADLIGPRRYRLTRLLRGQCGTEALAQESLAAGAILVVLDGHPADAGARLADVGRPRSLRLVPGGRDIADPMVIEVDASVTATALRPLSPLRLKARREAGGVRITWVRRTRVDGDSWGLADVPLGEETERYEVDILAGALVKRTLVSTSADVLYPSASEIADFGAAQTSLAVRVSQMSALAGRGLPAQAMLAL